MKLTFETIRKLIKEELNMFKKELREVTGGKTYPCDMIGPEEYNRIYGMLSSRNIDSVEQGFELLAAACNADVFIDRHKEYKISSSASHPFAGVPIFPVGEDKDGYPNFIDAEGMIHLRVFGRPLKTPAKKDNFTNDMAEETGEEIKITDDSGNQKFANDFFIAMHFPVKNNNEYYIDIKSHYWLQDFLVDFYKAYYDKNLDEEI